MDVKAAYLHAPIDTDVYVQMPQGYEKYRDGKQLTCHLQKSLYGLKQSARNWNSTLTSYIKDMGFSQSSLDACLFTKTSQHGEEMIILVWVDDLLIASTPRGLNEIKEAMKNKFNMEDIGPVNYFLGIKFERTADTFSMNQSAYIGKILDRFGMSDCYPVSTPAVEGISLVPNKREADNELDYRGLIGSLIYLVLATRPDIAWVVGKLSQFLNNPSSEHVTAAKRVLRYLKATKDQKLIYTKQDEVNLVGYSDSDWAQSIDDRKSTSGYVFKLSGPISWRAKKQPTVALSSCEAEYMALTETFKEEIYLTNLLMAFNTTIDHTLIFCDNQGTISLAHNPVQHQRSKHIDIRHHFIREHLQSHNCHLKYVRSGDNPADALTKSLGRVKFNELCDLLFNPESSIKGAC